MNKRKKNLEQELYKFYDWDHWKEVRNNMLHECSLNTPIELDDISYDLNNEIPKLYIKGMEVGIVSVTKHYVTKSCDSTGINLVTFVYMEYERQRALSVDLITGEVFSQ